MSKVTFKFPFDVQAECRITGFKGTLICRTEAINGCVQYGLQPKIGKEDGTYVPEAKAIDEGYVIGPGRISEDVEFKFDCGDKVRSIVNGFEGVITCRKQWLNGCLQYTVEGQMVKSELHGLVAMKEQCWEAEIELSGKQPKERPEKKRTGGPMSELKVENSL